MLLAGAAIAKHGGDRAKIRDGLAAIRTEEQAFPGVTGRLRFDADGNCLRPIRFVQVQKGRNELAPRQLD